MLLRTVAVSFSLCFLVIVFQQVTAEEIGWRYDGTGHFPAKRPPQTWSTEENVIWKTKLPGRSLASPVVVGDRVFVTANPTDLVCLSANDGQLLWSRSHGYHDVFDSEKAAQIDRDHAKAEELREQIDELQRQRREANEAGDAEKKEQLQQRISDLEQQVRELRSYPPPSDGEPGNTGPTPLSDGSEVFALFGTGIVSSHSVDGQLNWMTYIEAGDSKQTASPLLADNKLIIQLRHLTALDRATGETLWQTETPSRNGSPVIATVDGTQVVITPSGAVVRASDGELLARDQFRL